jgi:hypothetical protein
LSLQKECKLDLFAALPSLIKSSPVPVLSTFLERTCVAPFQQPLQDVTVAAQVLRGLAAALRVPDPPAAVPTLLYAATGKLYSLIPDDYNVSTLYHVVSLMCRED